MNNQTLPLNVEMTFDKNIILQKMNAVYKNPLALQKECDKDIDLSPNYKSLT